MRIALTGPDGDEGPLGEALRRLGIETRGHPLLRETPPREPEALANAVRGIDTFDLLAFTSARAVRALVRAIGVEGAGRTALAVGPATADAATRAGFHLAAVATDARASGLLAALDGAGLELEGCRVLLPVSERARPELADGLAERGAKVEVVAAYSVRTVDDPGVEVRALCASGASAALVASPSAVAALVDGGALVAEDLPPLVAIGPTTRDALELAGLTASSVAERPDAAAVQAAVAALPENQEK